MFFSNFDFKGAAKFVGHQLLLNLARASGNHGASKEVPARDTQCVKLSKDHDAVLKMVMFWCSIRLNKLELAGIPREILDDIIEDDARFINKLEECLDAQKKSKPRYDTWLFFNSDIRSTDFFELQQCLRGTKTTKVSYIIQSEL